MLVTLALATVLGQVPGRPDQPATGPAVSSPSSEYRLGPKDVVDVKVFEVPELNGEHRISEDGNLALPLIGDVPAGGLTTRELARRLETILVAKYVQQANVSISIKDFQNKPISFVGAVARPGILAVSGRWRLLQALTAVGGLGTNAGKKLYVLRTAENGLADQLEVNLDDLLTHSSVRWNVPIWGGDVVNVPADTVLTVFCLGEVARPGAIEFRKSDRISLLSVLSKAGGLTERASKGTIRVKRRRDGKDTELSYSYRRILSGKDADPELAPDDVVVVKEAVF